MSLDSKVLENRLIYKDSVVGGGASLARCATKLAILMKSSDIDITAYESLLRDMLLNKTEIDRSCKALNIFEDQMNEYRIAEETLNKKILDTREKIGQLKVELDQEKEIRVHRIACEEKAKEINKHTCRSVLKRKITETESNIRNTILSIERAENRIEIKNNQFTDLINSIGILESKVEDDAVLNADFEEEGDRDDDREDRNVREDDEENDEAVDDNDGITEEVALED